jgi:Tol biopolymer transport system component
MSSLAGTRLGAYEVTSLLGEGGMGAVYRGRDTRLDRDVAIKVLLESVAHDPDRLARFEREARLLASLNHPHIAQVYGLEVSDTTSALVMELVEGLTLADRIAQGPLPIDEALSIARQTADALDAAHEQGIVHRDLKPANIKLRPDGVVKVLDFGLAKLTDPAIVPVPPGAMTMSPTMMSPTMTSVGAILGTAAYMSPEQARGRTVDRRADIWAFGVVLFEMLVGTRPFTGDDMTETLASVVKDPPDLERVPPQVRKLLRKCLEKDPRRRLRDIGDVWELLDEGAAERAAAAPTPVRTWRRVAPWAIAAVVALLGAAVAAMHLLEPAAAPPEAVRFQISVPQLTAGNGTPNVSPDGRHIVYQANNRIFVRDLDAIAPRVLTTTDAAVGNPFWSADSRSVIFDAAGKLTKLDAGGGPPRVLCELSGVLLGGFATGDRIVFIAAPHGVRQVSVDGGTPTTLGGDQQVSLNGGSRVLTGGRFIYSTTSGVYVASLDGAGSPMQVSPTAIHDLAYVPGHGHGDDHLLFVSAGALLAQTFDARTLKLSGEPVVVAERVGGFSASETGTIVYGDSGEGRRLVWMNRQGVQTGTAWAPEQFNELSLAPDGSKVAVVVANGPSTWVHDFARESSVKLSDYAAVKPIWSPDGSIVIFAANREGHFDIYSAPAGGGGPETLILKSSAMKYPLSWSKDGKWLLYTSVDPVTKEDLWVVPMSGSHPGTPEPVLATNYRETDASFSPDGRFIAYVSDESGTSEVYVRAFPSSTGGKWLVSRGGGYQPRWRSDGKELLYISGHAQLMSVDVHAATTGSASGASRALFPAPVYGGGATINNWYWDVAAGGERMFFNAGSTETGASLVTVLVHWQPGSRPQADAR